MIWSAPQPKHAIVLRTILNAGVLAVLLAGAAWFVDDDGNDDACDGVAANCCRCICMLVQQHVNNV